MWWLACRHENKHFFAGDIFLEFLVLNDARFRSIKSLLSYSFQRYGRWKEYAHWPMSILPFGNVPTFMTLALVWYLFVDTGNCERWATGLASAMNTILHALFSAMSAYLKHGSCQPVQAFPILRASAQFCTCLRKVVENRLIRSNKILKCHSLPHRT